MCVCIIMLNMPTRSRCNGVGTGLFCIMLILLYYVLHYTKQIRIEAIILTNTLFKLAGVVLGGGVTHG